MKRSAHSVEGVEEEEKEEKERRRRRRLGGGRDEEGWAWRQTSPQHHHHHSTHQDDETSNTNNDNNDNGIETIPQPFTDALATYLDHHLALDIFHPGVRVLRVVCDAFALSEGRVKIFHPPPTATITAREERQGAVAGRAANTVVVETFLRDLIRRAQGRNWGPAAMRLAAL